MFGTIPRKKVYVTSEDIKHFLQLLIRRKLKAGKNIDNFEKDFAAYIGAQHATMTSSGREALRLILQALDLAPEDEILVPALTFNIVPRVIASCGLKPVFIDVSEEDYNIDTRLMVSAITHKTKAVVATHIFGTPCNMNKILDIATAHNLIVIEDCAQAMGAQYQGQKVGSIGDCALFSFESAKPFSTFGGGAIVTNNDALEQKIRVLLKDYAVPRTSAIAKRFFFSALEALLSSKFIFTICIYPFLIVTTYMRFDVLRIFKKAKSGLVIRAKIQMSNFQALVGAKRLPSFEDMVMKRSALAERIKARIRAEYKMQNVNADSRSIYSNFVIGLRDVETCRRELLLHGIDVDTFAHHDCSDLFGNSHSFHVAQSAVNELISLPLHYDLSQSDESCIAETLMHMNKG